MSHVPRLSGVPRFPHPTVPRAITDNVGRFTCAPIPPHCGPTKTRQVEALVGRSYVRPLPCRALRSARAESSTVLTM